MPERHRPASRNRCLLRKGALHVKWTEWEVARLTGLEPATPGVTGRYSNQLSYNRA